jgi:hypothetical protein
MNDLEALTMALIFTTAGTAVFSMPGLYMWTSGVRRENEFRKEAYLRQNFGSGMLPHIKQQGVRFDRHRKGVKFIDYEVEGQRYIMELEHEKTSVLTDLFYDTRLYRPMRMYKPRV